MSALRLFDKFAKLLDVSWSSIADGQLLKRSGTNIIGVAAAGGLPQRYIAGCVLSNNVTDATNDIDIASGVCRDETNTYDITLTASDEAVGCRVGSGNKSGRKGYGEYRGWNLVGVRDLQSNDDSIRRVIQFVVDSANDAERLYSEKADWRDCEVNGHCPIQANR